MVLEKDLDLLYTIMKVPLFNLNQIRFFSKIHRSYPGQFKHGFIAVSAHHFIIAMFNIKIIHFSTNVIIA